MTLPDHLAPADTEPNSVGAFNRRSFLRIGGVVISGAAVLAACSGDNNQGFDGPSASTLVQDRDGQISTTAPASAAASDQTLLRTAASLERVAIAVYEAAIESKAFAAGSDALLAANLFVAHHKDHRDVLDGLTVTAGAKVYDQPNPVVLAVFASRLETLASADEAATLALEVERAIADTYLDYTTSAAQVSLRPEFASIGCVQARHVTYWRASLGLPTLDSAFASPTNAVEAAAEVSAN